MYAYTQAHTRTYLPMHSHPRTRTHTHAHAALHSLNRTGKIVATSAVAGTALFVSMVLMRRYMLRYLLGYRGWLYERPGHASTKTKIWSVCMCVCECLCLFVWWGERERRAGVAGNNHREPK